MWRTLFSVWRGARTSGRSRSISLEAAKRADAALVSASCGGSRLSNKRQPAPDREPFQTAGEKLGRKVKE